MKLSISFVISLAVLPLSAADIPQAKSSSSTVSGKESPLAAWTAKLTSDDARERGEAAQRLAQSGAAAKSALPVLLQNVDDASIFVSSSGTYRVSHETIAAIRKIDPAYVFPPEFVQHLLKRAKMPPTRKKDQNAWMTSCGSQSLAIDSLSRMGPAARTAIPDLVRLGRNPCTGTAAREALVSIGTPSPEQTDAIFVGLADKDLGARLATIDYVGTLPAQTPGLAMALGKNVADPSSAVRLAAVQALEKIHPEGEGRLPVLAPLLKDPARSVREGALTMIGQMTPGPVTTPLLKEALKDKDALIVQQAAQILESQGSRDPDVVKVLEPLRELERKRQADLVWAQSTATQRLQNARTMRVKSIKTAKEIVRSEPVRTGRVFRAGNEPVVCWTAVTLSAAPAALTHTWYLKNEVQAEYTLPVTQLDDNVWSRQRVKPGTWKIVVTAPGVAEPLATITFDAVK